MITKTNTKTKKLIKQRININYVPNVMIEFEKYDYDLRQGKVHAFIEGQIPSGKFIKTGERPLYITFKVRDILNFAGYRIEDYNKLTNDLQYLATKWVIIKFNGKAAIYTGWICNDINEKERDGTKGVITIKINESLLDYYYMTENFTRYKTEIVKYFTSKYSKPLYEYFKMKKTKDRVLTYEEDLNYFYIKFDLSDNYQKDFNAFKYRILDPALEDINTYSDLKVSYGEKIKGRNELAFTVEIK